VYAIVDHTKWGRVASATSCRVDRLRGVITDEAAPADVTARLRQMGIVVHVAAEAEPAPSGEVVRE
jgi:DeoR/GlpR family transcriptional regulator of sugar metabolism